MFRSADSPRLARAATIAAHGAVTLALAWTCVAVAAETDDAGIWLERMSRAARTLDYEGTFVYRSGNLMQSLRVIHRGGGDERERLITLNGATREVVRDEHTVTCILPENRRVLVGRRRVHGAIAASSVLDPGLVRDASAAGHYRFRSQDGERVAGRDTRLVSIIPGDRYRYGYRLFADRATGLMVKSQLVGESGSVLEEVVFTTLTLPKSISDQELKPHISADGFERVSIEPMKDDGGGDDARRWQVGWLPDGFVLSERARDAYLPDERGVQHLVYTDGLALVSVFIERAGDESDEAREADGASRMGAVSAYVRRVGDYRVTVMGEVPSTTVELVARSVSTS